MQGLSATSPEVGTAVLSSLPGANPHRPACPESGLCNAGVHAVWVSNVYISKHTQMDFRDKMIILSSCSGVRPFGVSLLIAGWDEDHPYLFQSDPSVCCCNYFILCIIYLLNVYIYV